MCVWYIYCQIIIFPLLHYMVLKQNCFIYILKKKSTLKQKEFAPVGGQSFPFFNRRQSRWGLAHGKVNRKSHNLSPLKKKAENEPSAGAHPGRFLLGLFDRTTVFTLCIQTDSPEHTAYTQIRRHRTRRLIRVYTVCHSSINFTNIHRQANGLVEEKYKVKCGSVNI